MRVLPLLPAAISFPHTAPFSVVLITLAVGMLDKRPFPITWGLAAIEISASHHCRPQEQRSKSP
jgi:hypothetical protein